MAHRLSLSFAMGDNPRSRPILAGQIVPEGISLVCSQVSAGDLFWRQLKYQEFEASEMSLSSLIMMQARGDRTWVGLPIFTTRSFFHLGLVVRPAAGITRPEDLAGKSIGVPEYQQTAALWMRGILQHEFGVDLKSIHWYMERLLDLSHAEASGFVAPDGIELSFVEAGSNLSQMMNDGELDSALRMAGGAQRSPAYSGGPGALYTDRGVPPMVNGASIQPLFPDPPAEAARYFEKTGFFPINHCVVIRRDVLEKNPWVALNLFQAFVEAKRLARAQFVAQVEPLAMTGTIDAMTKRQLETDVFPYGVKAQRELLETVVFYSLEQGLIDRLVPLDEVFHPALLEM